LGFYLTESSGVKALPGLPTYSSDFLMKAGSAMASVSVDVSEDQQGPSLLSSPQRFRAIGAQDIWAIAEDDEVPHTSIIIPTRNEAGNIPQLLKRLDPVVRPYASEIIFVDDSEDATPDVIASLGSDFVRPVRLIHRRGAQRTGGLGGAVLEGMRSARGMWVVVMDGDLQHPPEVIPQMLGTAIEQRLDLVIANRYCEGGSAGSFSPIRLLTSRGSTWAAKAMFPHRLRRVDDPMTGFFMIRRDVLDLNALRPNGFKILLEIVARTPSLHIGSVPFTFGERLAGESKASLREGLHFLSLLCTLRFGNNFARFLQFGLVGVSGLLVNTLLLAFLTEAMGIFYMMSLILATQGSTLWNFLLSEHVVFGDKHRHEGEMRRAGSFFAMNNVALLARGPMVFGLTSLLGFNYLVSNVLSMAVLLVARYALADSIIWKNSPNDPPLATATASFTGISPDGDPLS
jgi:dolichol-phosphate mannosyltransferase